MHHTYRPSDLISLLWTKFSSDFAPFWPTGRGSPYLDEHYLSICPNRQLHRCM